MPANMDRKEFGKLLTVAYTEAGLNRQAFADRIGVSYTMVYKYDRGISMPTVDRLVEIARVTGCSTDALLGLTPRPQ